MGRGKGQTSKTSGSPKIRKDSSLDAPAVDSSPLEKTGIPVLDFAGGRIMAQGVRELLLERGSAYERDDSLTGSQWDNLSGEAKMCFMNAAQAALEYPDDLTYVEGYAFAKEGWFPMEHAWLIDKKGNIIDKTWPEGYNYYGIPFSNEDLRAILLMSESYGILDKLWHNENVRAYLGLKERQAR